MAIPTPDFPSPGPTVPDTTRPDADPVAHTLALLRPWIEYVPQQQRRLGLFILLALLAHLTAFHFIRIDTTRAELQHLTRVHVTVESPQVTSVAGQPNDTFWDHLTDPRLFLLPLESPGSLTANEPSLDFAEINPDLGSRDLPPPAPPEDYRIAHPIDTPLPQRVEMALTPPRQPFSYDETPPAIMDKTTWQWDQVLQSRLPRGLPDLPAPVSDTDLSPTILRVAVDPDGAVEHVLVDQSSGELGASGGANLDEQAVLAAQKIRFQPSDQPGLTWGRLTVFWHYSAKPVEEVVPTPPSGP
jgi:TonB family protein